MPISARRSTGRTGARLVDPGNLVHASDNTALVTIAQMKPIFVAFTVPQSYLTDIRRDQAKAPLAVQALDANAREVLADRQDHADRQSDRRGDRHDPAQSDLP